MKTGLVGLLMILSASALCGSTKSRWDIAPVFRIQLPPMPLVVEPVVFVQTRSFPAVGLGWACGGGFGRRPMCGGVAVPEFPESRLLDPVAMIGAVYLQSRSVKVALLDPEFPVADYREGYFGRWVQDGMLVKEQRVFTGELEIRQVFALLVEAMGEPDESDDSWPMEPGHEMSAADFRWQSGFVPELSFEFVGGAPLRIELNATQRRILIQAGDRWGAYALDRWTAAALKELLVGGTAARTQ